MVSWTWDPKMPKMCQDCLTKCLTWNACHDLNFQHFPFSPKASFWVSSFCIHIMAMKWTFGTKKINARGNLIWPKLKHGAMNFVLHEARFWNYRSFFKLGPPHIRKLVCVDKMYNMKCKTTRFHAQVTFFTLVLTQFAIHDFLTTFTWIQIYFTRIWIPTHSL